MLIILFHVTLAHMFFDGESVVVNKMARKDSFRTMWFLSYRA